MRVFVDQTHLWRPMTGLERVTCQQFSREALAPFDVVPVKASRMSEMLLKQTFALPSYLARTPSSLLLCPGFPPTPLLQAFRGRVIPYIHDVFLLSRRGDLNWRAKAYMAGPFKIAVRRLPRFLVNSRDTATKLARYCREDAEIIVYRPQVDNNFKLCVAGRAARPRRPKCLRLVALGTVEPRKNLLAAAGIIAALRQQGLAEATLEVIGRRGWGDAWRELRAMPGVVLHGYQPDRRVTAILDRADALISTSHEEGLGLPLLEAQYAGMPVIATDLPIFREILDHSGVFIDPSQPLASAKTIADMVAGESWRLAFIERAGRNLRRWNDAAKADRSYVIEWLSQLGRAEHHVAGRFQTAN